jgi:phage-related protein
MNQNFEIEILPEAVEFLESLEERIREKVYYNMRKSQLIHDKELFKKLNEFIWEFRTEYNNKSYRFFSFWDKTENQGAWVIATHGILKKTQKTPPKEIKKAEEIRKKYLSNKSKK